MDFNNVSARVKRLNVAVDEMSYSATEKDTNQQRVIIDGIEVTFIDFGDLNSDQLSNGVMGLLGQISNLKDILKNKAEELGINKQKIEDSIEKSDNLKLVIDIVNAEKHGYPTESNRSGKNPKIAQLFQAKNFSNNSIEIAGRVVDSNDEWIIDLEEMVEGAVDDLENLMKSNGLV